MFIKRPVPIGGLYHDEFMPIPNKTRKSGERVLENFHLQYFLFLGSQAPEVIQQFAILFLDIVMFIPGVICEVQSVGPIAAFTAACTAAKRKQS